MLELLASVVNHATILISLNIDIFLKQVGVYFLVDARLPANSSIRA